MKTRTIVHLIGKVKKKTALHAMLQGTLGWGWSRLASDWYVQWSPLRVSSAFSISLSISNTSFSSGPLTHGWKIGRPALPSALLAKWNPFFSHKLLGRRHTFFFFVYSRYFLDHWWDSLCISSFQVTSFLTPVWQLKPWYRQGYKR